MSFKSFGFRPSWLLACLLAIVLAGFTSTSFAQTLSVTRLSGDAELLVAPDGSGFVLGTPGTQKSDFLVQIESPTGTNVTALEVSPQYGQTTFTTTGDGEFFLDAPVA